MTRAMVPRSVTSIRREGFKAGIPKPMMYRTTMKGTPRKMSVYAAARKRIGKNTGPPKVRAAARRVAKIATPVAAISSMRMLSHMPERTAGKELFAYSQLKKVCWVVFHPGDEAKMTTMSAAMIRVEIAEIKSERVVRARR